ncbi:leucine Rich Repeat domain-containing protein [Arthroderma uncinatum]|uniref:leucine Rich Repeat domain-containing protein n=1 Tax=Arthroderma uncinatum TaxID=74035 RepID=UPI00144AF58D|nr:leucine Rich Repeat domain-containing protein [Arthroderma uncinatum]KAF3491282.1 leucine Rich Repeat domain-containing protein [Arthroderma uncinatum]
MCFLPYDESQSAHRANEHFGPLTGALLANSIESDQLDDHLLRLFTKPLTGRSALEELPHVGVTHLYIAGNNFSSDGLISLLQTRRLNVFDAGATPLERDKLIPIFRSPAVQGLRYLKVHHSVVTEGVTSKNTLESLLAEENESSEEMIQALLDKRPTFCKANSNNMDDHPDLHPSNVAYLQTLVLTDIPASVPPSSPIISSLTRFISACADESLLASLQAQSNYSLPPGQYRAKAVQQHAKELFALSRIVLEITPTGNPNRPESLPTWAPASYYQRDVFKSSTGDLDTENLWAAAANDFSFFGEEEESKNGLRPQGPRSPLNSDELPPARMVDLVAALAAFRREKRDGHNKRAQDGRSRLLTADGHWEGEVKILRNPL